MQLLVMYLTACLLDIRHITRLMLTYVTKSRGQADPSWVLVGAPNPIV